MKKLLLGLLPVLCILLTSRCTLAEDIEKLQGAVDSLGIVIGTPTFETGVYLDFINAKSKNYVDEVEIKVNVTGTDGQYVYNNLGVREDQFLSRIGMMELVIDPRKVDSVSMLTTPLEFNVTVQAEGYNPVTQKIKLFKPGMQMTAITLVKLDDAPEGISASVTNNFVGTNSSGRTTQKGEITMNSGEQSITINEGVVMRDEAGNPVTGTIAASAVFFDPLSQAAQDAFPGGLTVVADMGDNTTEDIRFVSAGMFDLRLTAGGKNVSSFDNGGITLKTEVSPELINPNTGQPLKENDVIELWSQDEGTGKWVFEKMDTVRNVNGKLVLEETVTHLSLWNWDFYYNTCEYGARFVFRGNIDSDRMRAEITAVIDGQSFDEQKRVRISTVPGNHYNEIILSRVPSNTPAKFTFEDGGGDRTVQLTFNPSTLDISNVCDGQTYYIDVTDEKANEIIKVNFDLQATSASNSRLIIRPNATIYYRPAGEANASWNTAYLSNGQTTIDLPLAVTYEIQAAFGNNSGKGTLRIERDGSSRVNVIMTPDIEIGSGGTTAEPITLNVARPSSNTIRVRYTAVLPDNVFDVLRVKESSFN